MLTRRDDQYEIDTDIDRLDLPLVHKWLSTDAYWAKDRERTVVEQSVQGSLAFGLYSPAGDQVGFARVVTDLATFAWLCDVYIASAERGRGLGSWLIEVIRDRVLALGVYRIVLVTADAHEVYAAAGFAPLAEPDRWMELDTRGPVGPETVASTSATDPTGKDPAGGNGA